MEQIVAITRQGQLTIPKKMQRKLGIMGATRAKIKLEQGKLIVEPTTDWRSLSGSMKTSVKLTDKQLALARRQFEKDWASND